MPKRVFAFKSAVPSSWLNLIENHTHLDPTAEGAGGQLSIKTEDIQTAAITPAKLSTGHPTWDTSGTLSATAFSGPLVGAYQGGYRRNLKITTTGGDKQVYVTAGQLLATASTGLAVVLNNVSIGIDSTIVGANGLDTGTLAASTWYSVWVINNPTTASTVGLLSLSATAPTLPSGYIYSTRVGWIRTDATANKYPLGILQVGNRAQYRVAAGSNVTAVPCIISGTQGTIGSTLVAASVSTVVPPTATVITGTLFNGGGAASAQCSPNSSVASLPGMSGINTSGASGSIQIVSFNFVLESTNIYYAGNGGGGCYCTGWEDNL